MPLYGTLCLEVAKGPQPKLQPAFLPEKKCGEQFLEGGPIVRKLQLNHHIAQTETIRIFEVGNCFSTKFQGKISELTNKKINPSIVKKIFSFDER